MDRRIEEEYENLKAMYRVMGKIIDDIEECNSIIIKECKVKALTDTIAEVVKQCFDVRFGGAKNE